MAIEFACPNCNKHLRTSEDRAGARAKCPDCGSPVTVPSPQKPRSKPKSRDTHEEDDYGFPESGGSAHDRYDDDYGDGHDDGGYDDDDDYGAPARSSRQPSNVGSKPCPMCGEDIRGNAIRCRHCGEDLDDPNDGYNKDRRDDSVRSRELNIGEVISTAWEILTDRLGLALGGSFIASILIGLVYLLIVVAFLIVVLAFGAKKLENIPDQSVIFQITIQIMFTICLLPFYSFIVGGVVRFTLNFVTGKNPEISDLVTGGRCYGKVFIGVAAIFCVGLVFGIFHILVASIVGANAAVAVLMLTYFIWFIISIPLWPYFWVIVDKKVSPIEAVQRSFQMTKDYLLHSFLLSLFMAVLVPFMGLGVFFCGFGFLFVAAFMCCISGVAYCHLAGKRTL